MIDFYNAFISYRHAPLDSAIAEHIQHKLEHFHVPHNLRKKLKHQKITRIFRDKEELPITSDLTETITQALEKAEFLIVICSTNTKESVWVKREINTFLKTHTPDKILTVLCDGDPYEVIPEELLSVKKEYTDENGAVHTIEESKEPLSCDYRLPRKTADKEELPRLASALLGCSYDELQRRRRQYRIRRAAAVAGIGFAALTAFGVYMAVTNRMINNNYIASLRSRSLYLANESSQLMDEGKRVDALQLALAALPDGPKDKTPLTAEALSAVTKATYAYHSCSGWDFYPTWNFKTHNKIEFFVVSPDGNYLAARDAAGCVYCWDAIERQLIFEESGENETKNIIFLSDDVLLITYRDSLKAFDAKSGEVLWDYDPDYSFLSAENVVYANGKIFLETGAGDITVVSAKDGKEVDTFSLKDYGWYGVSEMAVSPDADKLAFSSLTEQSIGVYDVKTHEFITQTIDFLELEEVLFTDDDHLILMTSDEFGETSVELSRNLKSVNDGYKDICCYDSSLNRLWKETFQYGDVVRKRDMLYLSACDSVLVYCGNTASIFDVETGEEERTYKTSSSIIDVSDNDGDGEPMIICEDGKILFAKSSEDNSVISMDVLGNGGKYGAVKEAVYVLDEDYLDIICYGIYLQDGSWTPVRDEEYFTGSTFQAWYCDEDYLIICGLKSDEDIFDITVIDPNSGEISFTTSIDKGKILLGYRHIERAGNKAYIFLGTDVFELNLDKEKIKEIKMSLEDHFSISDGKVFEAHIKDEKLILEVTDLEDMDTQKISLKNMEDDLVEAPIYVKEINKVFIPVVDKIYVADLDSESIEKVHIPDGWTFVSSYQILAVASEKGDKILLSDRNTILVMDSDMEELYTITCNGLFPCGAFFKDDSLYVPSYEDLLIYDADTGELTGKIDMDSYYAPDADVSYDEDLGLLFVTSIDLMNIFDPVAQVKIATVNNAYGYHKGSDRFYTYSYMVDEELCPGYIERYNTEGLIEKAKELLHDEPIPVEYQSKYGIG